MLFNQFNFIFYIFIHYLICLLETFVTSGTFCLVLPCWRESGQTGVLTADLFI